MKTKEMIEVMQAYADGKVIESRRWSVHGVWYEVSGPVWDWSTYEYRIKPEPKYRPYKDTDEMIEDFEERFAASCLKYALPLIWIKSKSVRDIRLVTSFDPYKKCAIGITMSDLYDNFTYLDGSPVGKAVEE